MVRTIEHNGKCLAMIIPGDYTCGGIKFFTPPEFSQQLAFMSHPAGKSIAAHTHTPVPRTIQFTHEVLVIKKGRLRADFYDTERNYIQSCIVKAGDVLLLASGGHGFEVLDELEMIEIKQGPFVEQDKVRFAAVDKGKIIIKE
jgi:hypothetical protein